MSATVQEQLLSKTTEILSALQTGVEKTGAFAAEQLPDIALQFIAYGRVITVVSVLWWVALSGVLAYMTYKLVTAWDKEWQTPFALLTGGGSLACWGGIAHNTGPMLMVWFAPKIYLITEIARLLK